jgi:hypothetical protein
MWAIDAAAGVRPEQREAWPPVLSLTMADCWAAEPSQRPSFRIVIDRLAPMLQPQLFTDPTKPKAGADGGCCMLQ